ncbi:outer membrane protein assembly factor [Seonamhaeicola algicola]|uniref:Outer membrane protein assembly factor n=3 Tax=Seonamhaeicola TaxID=1649495 RepID=A0A5C7ABK7_9FLAO|nr:POTRA domain-containing protein [Seonamhaeicola algicola]TXE06190.1 outer membrane protein assembly factor [Seonamhaeicola algicola]
MRYFLVLCILFVCAKIGAQEYVNSVKVQGNKRLKASFVKKISTVKAGGVLDSLQLNQDTEFLKRLPSVSHAYYQVFKTETGNYNVVFNIEESFTLIPSPSIYTTNNGEFAFRIGLTEFNLFGQNIGLGAFYQHDIYDSYAINFRAPFLFSNKFGLAVNLQDLTTLEPVFFNNSSADYRYNNESVEVLGLYKINFKNRFEFGATYFSEDYSYVSGVTSSSVPQNLEVNKWLAKLIYEYNNLSYHYQYVSGFRSLFNFQYVTATNSELPNFFITWNDFFYFKRVGKKGNWANRMRVGLSQNDNTPFAPFSVDNNINIRGVGNTIDRGTGAIVFNTEYRHTLIDKKNVALQSNVFLDSGTWRNPGGTLSDFTNSNNLKIYSGLGLRFIHKKIFNAIFRIDYGLGLTENASQGLVFGIGQYF